MSSKTYQAYLLGLLPEAELAQVEQTLITDGDCYEQVLMAEGDLIDNYLRGRLSSAERQRFDEHFLLTPERQEQFRFMQILHGYVDRTPQVQGQQPSVKSWWERLLPFPVTAPAWKYAQALALLALAVGGIWFLFRLPKQPDEQIVKQPTPNPLATAISTATPTNITGTRKQKVDLSSGQEMSSGSKSQIINVTPEDGEVQLKLHLDNDQYANYQATLLDDDDENEATNTRKLPQQFQPQGEKVKYLLINLAVAELPHKNYRLKLQGLTSDGKWENAETAHFQIIHK